MSTPGSLRQRGAQAQRKAGQSPARAQEKVLDQLVATQEAVKKSATTEWDYKLALVVITTLAFITRFWGINHPDQVVFDEVHFGKVSP
jgi:dolichyl-phosphate-mannose-protein mannosyltransferase